MTADVVTACQTRKLCYRKDDLDRMSRCGDGHSKLSKMAAAAILDLF